MRYIHYNPLFCYDLFSLSTRGISFLFSGIRLQIPSFYMLLFLHFQPVHIHIPDDMPLSDQSDNPDISLSIQKIPICITKISTFLILCDLAVCLATLYVSFSLVFALMRYLQGKVFLIRFYSPTTLSSSRAEFRLPSRLACA